MHVAPRRLGSWGLEVGCLGLGCMSMTGVYDVDQRQDDRSEQTVRRALDLGATLIDTADSYGPFTNELLVGRAVAGRPGAVISTKVGLVGRSDGQLIRNGRPDYIREAADASLRRLQVDRIDLYSLHDVDPDVPLAETWDAMASLVHEGKVRALGVMTNDRRTVETIQQRFPVTAVFAEFSLWNQDNDDLVDWCSDRAISVLATSPLGRGFLTGSLSSGRRFAWTDLRSRLPQFSAESLAASRPVLDRVKTVARRHRATPAQVALAWLLQRSENVIPVVGTKRPEHLDEDTRASDLTLTPDDLAHLAGEPEGTGVAGSQGS